MSVVGLGALSWIALLVGLPIYLASIALQRNIKDFFLVTVLLASSAVTSLLVSIMLDGRHERLPVMVVLGGVLAALSISHLMLLIAERRCGYEYALYRRDVTSVPLSDAKKVVALATVILFVALGVGIAMPLTSSCDAARCKYAALTLGVGSGGYGFLALIVFVCIFVLMAAAKSVQRLLRALI